MTSYDKVRDPGSMPVRYTAYVPCAASKIAGLLPRAQLACSGSPIVVGLASAGSLVGAEAAREPEPVEDADPESASGLVGLSEQPAVNSSSPHSDNTTFRRTSSIIVRPLSRARFNAMTTDGCDH